MIYAKQSTWKVKVFGLSGSELANSSEFSKGEVGSAADIGMSTQPVVITGQQLWKKIVCFVEDKKWKWLLVSHYIT